MSGTPAGSLDGDWTATGRVCVAAARSGHGRVMHRLTVLGLPEHVDVVVLDVDVGPSNTVAAVVVFPTPPASEYVE